MSGRFVRASLYRHVFGETDKTNQYTGMKLNWQGDHQTIACNKKYFAVSVRGGGGPVKVVPHGNIGRNPTGLMLNVHKAKVLTIDWCPQSTGVIATGSDNGHVCVSTLKMEGKAPEKVANNTTDAKKNEKHSKKILQSSFHPTAEGVLATMSKDNTIKIWDSNDLRQSMLSIDHCEATRFSWNSNGSLMCFTQKKDGNQIVVIDPRAPGDALTAAGAGGAQAQQSFFGDNYGFVYNMYPKSGGSGRKMQIFDIKKFGEPVCKDATLSLNGAAVMWHHYDPDNSILYGVDKGSTSCHYWELDAEGQCFHLGASSFNSACKGVSFMPKTAMNVPESEIAHCFYGTSDNVLRMSLKVPRKSTTFESKYYPDTNDYSQKISTPAEWADGKDVEPAKYKMDPDEHEDEEEVEEEVVIRKSPAQLESELADALKKIAALEAEIAKLKA